METIILGLIPSLANYPFLLQVVCVIFGLYSAGYFFSAFWGILTGYKGYK